MNSKIAALEGEIKKLPVSQQELMKITRKFDLNNVIFTKFLEKRNEADIVYHYFSILNVDLEAREVTKLFEGI